MLFSYENQLLFESKYHLCFNAKIEICNSKGQKVRIFEKENLNTGNHSIAWNGKDNIGKEVNSGIYLYRLSIDKKTKLSKKCLLLK